MVQHIVMWNFKEEISEEEKVKLKKIMNEKLCELVGQVPGLLEVKFVEEPLTSSTHEIALLTCMNTAEDVAIYASHSAHVFVADHYVRPYVKDRACLDYEIL